MHDSPMDESLKQALTLGRSYYQKKEYARAEQYLSQVVEQNQSFADVYNMLAIIYHDTGKYQQAQEAYRQALSHSGAAPGQLDRYVQGKLANMYAEIGDVYLSAGFYPEAIAEYERAL